MKFLYNRVSPLLAAREILADHPQSDGQMIVRLIKGCGFEAEISEDCTEILVTGTHGNIHRFTLTPGAIECTKGMKRYAEIYGKKKNKE